MSKPDAHARKLHPWLRKVKNGGRVVNATRSDGSTLVASAAPVDDRTAPPAADLCADGATDRGRAALDGGGAAAE